MSYRPFLLIKYFNFRVLNEMVLWLVDSSANLTIKGSNLVRVIVRWLESLSPTQQTRSLKTISDSNCEVIKVGLNLPSSKTRGIIVTLTSHPPGPK